MEIEEIKKKIGHDEYEISSHAEKERYDEDITIHDLVPGVSRPICLS